MVMGNMLRDREVQYIAMKDDTTQTWRILDSWHDGLKNVEQILQQNKTKAEKTLENFN